MKTKKLSKKIRLKSKTLIITVMFLLFSSLPSNALEKEEKKVAGTVPVAVATMEGETETMLPETTEILHDQLDGITGDAITSQDFEAALNDFDSEAADDFDIPSGETWTIEQVTVYGAVTEGAILNEVWVRFYIDVNGLPATSSFYQSLVSVNTTGSFIITLTQPLNLDSGRYWVSVQARMDYQTPQGAWQWWWNQRTLTTYNPSAWRNPGGGFGLPCTTWGSRVSNCGLGNSPDLIFALGGTLKTAARADLKPTPISYFPTAIHSGDTVSFDSGIQNIGNASSGIFNVRWLVDGQDVGAYGSHENVPAYSNIIHGNSKFDWKAVDGMHTITFVVDADNYVVEFDENNNKTHITAAVQKKGDRQGGKVDLIPIYTYYPADPTNGEYVQFYVGAKNVTKSSPGKKFKVNLTKLNNFELIGEKNINLKTYEVFVWKAVSGIHSIKLNVDVDNDIHETNELNNSKVFLLPVEECPPIECGGIPLSGYSLSSVHEWISSPGDYRVFKLKDIDLSFMYPSSWRIRELKKEGVDMMMRTLSIKGNSRENITINIFDKPLDVEQFIKSNVVSYTASRITDINSIKSVIAGCDGYSWINKDRGKNIGGTVVFFNDMYLFILNFTATNDSNGRAIDDLIQTLSEGSSGSTELNFDAANIEYPNRTMVSNSTCCDETDECKNGYPCCTNSGNCTWYCEKRIYGDNNFPQYGDGYNWMQSANFKPNTSDRYPTGGTIPEAGAIMVFESSWNNGTGHVAYVTGIKDDGSIDVEEQNCGYTCTQDETYNIDQLRAHLAGYIYVDKTVPAPTPKICGGSTIGSETIIDDYNFNDQYNFQTYGPGRHYNDNDNGVDGYGWGKDSRGHNDFFHWTNSRSGNARSCYGKWAFRVTHEGFYVLSAYIPNAIVYADDVKYKVANIINDNDWGATYSNGINQYQIRNSGGGFAIIENPNRPHGWWYFKPGKTIYVFLEDNHAGTPERAIAFDAIKVTRVR